MSFSLICYPVLLLSFLTAVNSENSNSKFTQKVRSDLPQESFKKLFNTDHDSVEQYLRALVKAEQVEAKIVGTAFPAELNDQLQVDIRSIADKGYPESLFRLYVNSVGETLEDMGVLNDDNIDELAKKLAKFLEDAAKSTTINNVEQSLPAISGAIFKYFASMGLATDEVLKSSTKNFLNQLNVEFS